MEVESSFGPLPAERVEYEPPTTEEVKERGWMGVAVIRLLSLLIVGAGVYYSTEGLVAMLVILIVPVEKLFPRHRGQKVAPTLQTRHELCNVLSIPNLVGLIAAGIVAVISFAWIPGLLMRPVVAQIPSEWLPTV